MHGSVIDCAYLLIAYMILMNIKYNSYKTRIAMLNYMRKNLDERMIAYEVKRNFMLKLRD